MDSESMGVILTLKRICITLGILVFAWGCGTRPSAPINVQASAPAISQSPNQAATPRTQSAGFQHFKVTRTWYPPVEPARLKLFGDFSSAVTTELDPRMGDYADANWMVYFDLEGEQIKVSVERLRHPRTVVALVMLPENATTDNIAQLSKTTTDSIAEAIRKLTVGESVSDEPQVIKV